MNPRLVEAKTLPDYKLSLLFTNNEQKIFDVKPYLSKGIFKELQSLEIFRTANVVDGTVQWANNADFCPDTLYLDSYNADE